MSYIRGHEVNTNKWRLQETILSCYAQYNKHSESLLVIGIYFFIAIVLIMASLHFSLEREDNKVVNYKQPIGEFIVNGANDVSAENDVVPVTLDPLKLVISSNSEALPTTSIPTRWQDICESAPEQCAPQWINDTISTLLISPKQRVVVCPIIGNFDSLLKRVACSLDENIMVKSNLTESIKEIIFDDESGDKNGCKRKNILRDFDEFRKMFPTVIKSWKFLTVVRHPLDRFVSLFTETCVLNNGKCFDCKANITCLLQSQHNTMLNFEASLTTLTPEEHMFLPQTWHCDLSQKFTMIKHDTNQSKSMQTADKLVHALRRKYVSQKMLEDIRDTFNNSVETDTSKSAVMEFVKNRILNNSYLFNLFIRCFYWDFRLLKYSNNLNSINETVEVFL